MTKAERQNKIALARWEERDAMTEKYADIETARYMWKIADHWADFVGTSPTDEVLQEAIEKAGCLPGLLDELERFRARKAERAKDHLLRSMGVLVDGR